MAPPELMRNPGYLTGRLGVRSEYTMGKDVDAEIKPWFYAGIQHEFTDAAIVTYIIDFDEHHYDTTNINDYNAWRIDLGLRLRW